MNVHKNAKQTPRGRERLVRLVLSGLSPERASRLGGISPRALRKWVARFKADGVEGLMDRSSRPHHLRAVTPEPVVRRIIALRRLRWTGKHIARETGVSPATVSRVLHRAGLSRLRDLDPPEQVRRYEREAPGDLIHIDIKKLGRFERPGHRVTGKRTRRSRPRSRAIGGYGWEYVHVCIDDHSRLSFSQIHADEKALSAIVHLRAAVAWYKRLGVKVTRVMTDNGSCYISKAFAAACRNLGLKHIRTRPYTPRTNGKAERFIQTALREWAYARSYATSHERAQALPGWSHMYNWHRPHSGIRDKTPISRLKLDRNNLLRHHT